jgi:hypothetical protein
VISEKAMGVCDQYPAHFNQTMHRQHFIGIGSLAKYIGEAIDMPPVCHAIIMVENSFDILATLFCLASIANKNKHEDNLGM